MKFKAAVLVELKNPLVLDELEVPPLQVGQVLVKVLCSGICGSQIGEIKGVKGEDRFLPHLLGHEAMAEVLECGPGVTTVSSGQRVVLHWRHGTGIQAACPVYKAANLGIVNAGWITTFNEMAVISENRMTVVPSDTDPEIGALMGCAVTTGLGVINNNAQVKIGQSVVVWGSGGVGLNIVQGAAMVSAHPIIAIDLAAEKLALAVTFGATHTINAAFQDPLEAVRNIVGTGGADVVIDNTGQIDVIRSCYDLTQAAGRTILVGVPTKGSETTFNTLPLHFDKVLTGSHGGEALPAIDIPRYLNLVKEGKLELKPLVTHHYELDQINQAITDMQAGRITGRCMISTHRSSTL
jgi:S-(hydroxymethyl)glutathione dehydrogenase/alcohol dehydrogenase